MSARRRSPSASRSRATSGIAEKREKERLKHQFLLQILTKTKRQKDEFEIPSIAWEISKPIQLCPFSDNVSPLSPDPQPRKRNKRNVIPLEPHLCTPTCIHYKKTLPI